MTTCLARTPPQSMIDSPPAIIIHSLDHALTAARAARDVGRPVTLASARGAAGYAGVGWFLGVVDEARRHYPDVELSDVLDCDDDIALAIEALYAGAGWIMFCGESAALDRVCDVAQSLGARINGPINEVFDLRHSDYSDCRSFLERTAPR